VTLRGPTLKNQNAKIGYLNAGNLQDLLAFHLYGMMENPLSSVLEWIGYTRSMADSPFHFNGLESKEFYFDNSSSDPTFPKSGIYRGSDINYYAVGMSLASTGSPLFTTTAVAGWNYGQAVNEYIRNGWSASWWSNAKQIVTAQPWARVGFAYSTKNIRNNFEGYE